MLDEILENRKKKSRMNNTTREDLIKKTEKSLLTLRKKQIDDYIMAKRIVTNNDNLIYQINPLHLVLSEDVIIDIPIFIKNLNLNLLENYLYSDDTNLMKYGLFILRKYIAQDLDHEKVFKIVSEKLIKHLCNLIDFPDYTVKFESSWILINITNYSDEAVNFLSTEWSLGIILDFFKNADEHLNEHALWLIGNMAADRDSNREFFVHNGIMEKINNLLEDIGSIFDTKEKVCWVICNLSRGKVYDLVDHFIDTLPYIVKILDSTLNEKVISEILYVLYKITSSTSFILNKLINLDLYRIVVKIMFKFDLATKYLCIKITANLVSGNDVQTQILIQQGIIDMYRNLLEETDVKLLKEALWGVSNVCAGTVSQIEKVLDAGIFYKVFDIMVVMLPKVFEDKLYYSTVRECAFCICNAITGGIDNTRIQILQNGRTNLIQLLYKLIQIFYEEKRLVQFLVWSINMYLKIEENEECLMNTNYSIRSTLLSLDIEELLQQLMIYPSEGVNQRAIEMQELLEDMGTMDINI